MVLKDGVNVVMDKKLTEGRVNVCLPINGIGLIGKSRLLVLEIQRLLKFIPYCRVVLISRNANSMADWIATHTRDVLLWLDYVSTILFSGNSQQGWYRVHDCL